MTQSTARVSEAARTSEIEEPTNRWLVHPISRAVVAPLARWGVSPNAVSLVGLALGAGAAVAYLGYDEPWRVALGFALMLGWHVADGADGQLARLTGKTSEIGRMLDGVVDHASFVLVYVALAWTASGEHGPWVWGLAVLAGASHAVQASAYEAQRLAYDVWARGKASARFPTVEAFRADLREMRGTDRILGGLYLLYLKLQTRTGTGDRPLEVALARASQERGAAPVAEAYRETHLAGVQRWNVLCSNYRTIAIAVACLVGSPVWFFAFEAVGLNAAFAALVAMRRRHDRALMARLSPSA